MTTGGRKQGEALRWEGLRHVPALVRALRVRYSMPCGSRPRLRRPSRACGAASFAESEMVYSKGGVDGGREAFIRGDAAALAASRCALVGRALAFSVNFAFFYGMGIGLCFGGGFSMMCGTVA